MSALEQATYRKNKIKKKNHDRLSVLQLGCVLERGIYPYRLKTAVLRHEKTLVEALEFQVAVDAALD
jgi:hypothetical protein